MGVRGSTAFPPSSWDKVCSDKHHIGNVWKCTVSFYKVSGKINRTNLSHVLLAGEDELVVDHPPRLLLKQAAVGVDEHRLLVFDCLVRPSRLGQPRRVVEEARCHRLKI